MEIMMEVAVVFAVLNIAVLAVLLYFYSRIAVKTRATYSIGLLIFALFLLAHNLLTVYSYLAMAPLFGVEAIPFLMWMAALEFIGLMVLIKITV